MSKAMMSIPGQRFRYPDAFSGPCFRMMLKEQSLNPKRIWLDGCLDP